MKHADHVELIEPAGLTPGGTWADLGAGTGAFTLALREVLGPQAEIYAVDKDRGSLDELQRQHDRRFGAGGRLHVLRADFRNGPELPPLDGVLMANSLHFLREKVPMLERVRSLLRPGGTLLLVEYNVDKGNPWVPYPLTFDSFAALAIRSGFKDARLLATHPSSFLREFYAATAERA
jgi:ubiquinone/menaquinone biosynthesis C-methylase UbiE